MHQPLISIAAYSLQFQPFSYRIQIKGTIEIESRYRLGTQLLVGRVNLPNQSIENIDLVPQTKSQCHNRSPRCSVFEFNSFIQMSGDKYFSREYKHPEHIPFQLAMDFNTNNLDSFFSLNRSLKRSHKSISEYIAAIKHLSIENTLEYQNSFHLHNPKTRNIISVPTSWTITNRNHFTQYENVEIATNGEKRLNNEPLADLFSIEPKGKISLLESYLDLTNGSRIILPPDEINAIKGSNYTTYRMQGRVRSVDEEYKYENDYKDPGIFLSSPIRGQLTNRLQILINNHGYHITIKQPINFSSSYLLDHQNQLTVWIQPRYSGSKKEYKKFFYL